MMNKTLLLAILAVGVLAQTECIIPVKEGTDCKACVGDIGSVKCTEFYKNTKDKACKKYVDCKRKESRMIDTTVCPAHSDRAEVCLKDFTGEMPRWGRDYQCGEWRKKGDCKSNPKFMIPYCMESCCRACRYNGKDNCPTVNVGNSCQNKYSSNEKCAGWAYAGECNKNPVWMKKNCAKDCCPACKDKVKSPAPAPAPVAPVFYQQPVYQQPVYQQPVYQQPIQQIPYQTNFTYQQPVYRQPIQQIPYQANFGQSAYVQPNLASTPYFRG